MTKLSQEELEQLQKVVSEYEQASFNVGQFTLEIENLKEERRMWIEKAQDALAKRESIQDDLEARYGSGKLNVITGEIENE